MNRPTEAAYIFAERYLLIHQCEEGYGYTFYWKNFKEIDGGVYDDSTPSLEEVVAILLEEESFSNKEYTQGDYTTLVEKAEELNRIGS